MADDATPMDIPLADACADAREAAHLRAQVDRLEAALRDRDDMLSAAAHELRNPLGVITINGGMLQRIAAPGPDGERTRIMADRIVRAARRISEQLGELGDAVKIDRGTLRVELAPRSVRGLLERATAAATPTAGQRGVELVAAPVADDLLADCDEPRILQVLAALLDRALQATPPSGRITVAAALAGAHVHVEVVDTGDGIAPDALARVFERRSGRAAVDLALYLARGLVEAHGGTIAADSAAGRGSTFRFTLPATRR